MQRSADRARPDAQLAAHDGDSRDVCDVHACRELITNGIQEEVSGGGDAPSDHYAVDAEQGDDVAGADAQVAAGVLQPVQRAPVPSLARRDSSFNAGLSPRFGDPTRLGATLQPPTVAAAAHRTVRDDRPGSA